MTPGFRWPHKLTSGGQTFVIWSSLCSVSFYFTSHTWTYIHTQTYMSESVSYHTYVYTYTCYICMQTHMSLSLYFITHTCAYINTQTYMFESISYHTLAYLCIQKHMSQSLYFILHVCAYICAHRHTCLSLCPCPWCIVT